LAQKLDQDEEFRNCLLAGLIEAKDVIKLID